MATLTAHFGWLKPVVNDPIDQDQWGFQLNGDLDSIDALNYAFSTTAIGSSRPSYAAAGTLWINNSASPWIWYVYDGTTDIEIGEIDPTAGSFTPAGLALLTAKGDLLTNNGTTDVRLPVGTDGKILIADSTQTTGLRWDNISTDLGAWFTARCNPGSSTVTILASENISSITYVTPSVAGNYQINFASPMPSGNYAFTGMVQRLTSDSASDGVISMTRAVTPTNTSCQISTFDLRATPRDMQILSMMFVGG